MIATISLHEGGGRFSFVGEHFNCVRYLFRKVAKHLELACIMILPELQC
jgi:hypothetical protein